MISRTTLPQSTAIKSCGGTTVVQEPNEADHPEMPMNALMHNRIDHRLPLADIAALLTRLARAKAEDARNSIANDKDIADAYVLAADTVVAVGRRVLVKPRFLEEAVAALQLLSGRAHRVLTALCLITPEDRLRAWWRRPRTIS